MAPNGLTVRCICLDRTHCVKSVRIRSFSGPDYPAFRLNMEIYSVNLSPYSVRMLGIRTRKTPNKNTSYAVNTQPRIAYNLM